MRTSESITEIAAALIALQAEIKPAEKNSKNPHFKNKYANLTSVRSACQEALAKNNLAVIQAPTFIDGRVVLITRVLHKSGQWLESELSIKPQQDSAQAIGSCITYAKRYCLAALIGVVDEDENDDDGEADRTAQPKPFKPTTPASKPPRIFNAHDAKQAQGLEAYLEKAGVSRDSFIWIKDSLHGKDLNTELQKIILAVRESEQ